MINNIITLVGINWNTPNSVYTKLLNYWMDLVTTDNFRELKTEHWPQSALFLLTVSKIKKISFKFDSAAPSGGKGKLQLVSDCRFQIYFHY
jgi:hypothetical protein